jgi:hypothetical protein
MSQSLPTPPTSPPPGALPSNLPPLPSPGETRKEAAGINRAFFDYYWPRHFVHAPADPATFIDRVLTDYSHERDIVGEWLEEPSRLYIIYRACLNYVAIRGTRAKAEEAKSYQTVVPKVSDRN